VGSMRPWWNVASFAASGPLVLFLSRAHLGAFFGGAVSWCGSFLMFGRGLSKLFLSKSHFPFEKE